MRLDILNNGYTLTTKFLFSIIKAVSGYRLPDAARLVFYRPDFYGSRMKKFTHKAMRGSSSWSVGDRELMAAFISSLNECTFCVRAHSAVSAGAYNDRVKVSKVLSGLETAPIETPLRATLTLLSKLTREHSINVNDIQTVMASGVSYGQIEDALAVCFAFNTTNRLADAFGFSIPSSEAFEAGAKHLLKRGYQ